MTDLSIPEKLKAVEASANAQVFERPIETACLINALVSRSHVSVIGVPGVAKTFLADAIVGLIGELGPHDYFKTQLGPRSDPADLLGPHSPLALREGRFSRNTAHKLPRARIAHISEFWRAPDSARDDLLSIMNEGLFYNGEDPEDCPLSLLIADSNTMPEAGHALADRFTFWLVTKPIQGRGNVEAMLRGAVDRLASIGTTRRPSISDPLITWAEIEQAQAEAARIPVSAAAINALAELRGSLISEGVMPSDRRLVACLPVMQAEAYLAGASVADLSHMKRLSNVLWTKPQDQPKVLRLIYGVSSPRDLQVLDLGDAVKDLVVSYGQIASLADVATRKRRALELHERVTAVGNDLLNIKDAAVADGQAIDLFPTLSATLGDLGRRLLVLLA